MTRTWLISDTHFGHENIYLNFTNPETGGPQRPWDNVSNAEEADEFMRDMWAQTIRPDDKVFHLGDVAMPRHGLAKLEGLPGRKVLLLGNHDRFKASEYLEHFEDICGTMKLNKFMISHYPLHPGSIPSWCAANIHGHTHCSHVCLEDDVTKDPRYKNICVEQTGGMPVTLEELMAEFSE